MEFKKCAEFDWDDSCRMIACVATTKTIRVAPKSSVIGSRDYRQVW
jgi:hypothetical protein